MEQNVCIVIWLYSYDAFETVLTSPPEQFHVSPYIPVKVKAKHQVMK
uniref:Uncharacterized protein n=1 Tax=Anguilla anguilla TaxID=7936 RepID=A0A0E9PYZ1_ANGAN